MTTDDTFIRLGFYRRGAYWYHRQYDGIDVDTREGRFLVTFRDYYFRGVTDVQKLAEFMALLTGEPA